MNLHIKRNQQLIATQEFSAFVGMGRQRQMSTGNQGRDCSQHITLKQYFTALWCHICLLLNVPINLSYPGGYQ